MGENNRRGRSRPGFKRRNRNFHRRGRGRRRGPRMPESDRVERSYLNLIEQYLSARQKYFELFHRADPKQLAKLDRSFHQTAKELHLFEKNMKPELKEKFAPMRSGLPLDTTYSNNRNLTEESYAENFPEPEEVEHPDPHVLQTQLESDFSSDNQESSGTMEDYLTYKNEN